MSKKLWGGRFSKETNPLVEQFTKSIHFDYKLAKYDVWGSLIHVQILAKAAYLEPKEAEKLKNGLEAILKTIKNETFKFNEQSEDIHSDIQNKLQGDPQIGDLVLKLQTARSRNEQVVFATKVYCKEKLLEIAGYLMDFIETLEQKGNYNKNIIIPGFTHLQHAQPVKLKDYLNAYVQMFIQDAGRLIQISSNIKITLGSGALTGTPITADCYNFIDELRVLPLTVEPTASSLGSVSDRDFVIETISALSIVAMHLSRLAEDLIIWSTKEFDFIELDDAYCTGSSLMPQKKNPDVLELIRGYTGRLYGNLVSVLTMMKGLPLTYNRDMQLDKEPLFDSVEIISAELKVLNGLIETLKFNEKEIEEHLKDESLYATDLVYYLVDKKVPFKEAHTIIGELVRYSAENNTEIKDLPEDILKEKFSNKIIKSEFIALFDPKKSVESKKSVDHSRLAADREKLKQTLKK